MVFWKKSKKDDESTVTNPAETTPVPAEPVSGGPQATAPARPVETAAPEPAAGSESSDAGPSTPIDATMTEAKVIEAIRTCYDPEIPVNIYELGLIYEVDVKESGEVAVKMTLTSPMCPVAGTLPHEVEAKVAGVAGVKSALVDLVWDPPWTPERMSEAAKLQLGML